MGSLPLLRTPGVQATMTMADQTLCLGPGLGFPCKALSSAAIQACRILQVPPASSHIWLLALQFPCLHAWFLFPDSGERRRWFISAHFMNVCTGNECTLRHFPPRGVAVPQQNIGGAESQTPCGHVHNCIIEARRIE